MPYYRTPDSVSGLLRKYTFHLSRHERVLYLTFDDGPHPVITPQVLELLEHFNAKASFFCVGDNLRKYPDVAEQVLEKGHLIGNHTFHHLNGWKTGNKSYFKDFLRAENQHATQWFRPPYGKIKPIQAKAIFRTHQIAMWDVLSGDYRKSDSPEICTRRVIQHSKPGSIIVFHDSEKAEKNMLPALKKTLEYFSDKGYQFKALPPQV
ncbi:polysaccharide deacetylase family protein [bacterium SCSIO 12741]|nr:polysaccharide deacetylase family protein [bacterium SCSIO 12741]